MKKIILPFLFAVFFFGAVNAQETEKFKPNGKPIVKIYSYYRYDMTQNVNQKSKFDIYRAYFGYKYKFSKNISAKLVMDVGKGDVSDYSFFLKNAQLDWKLHSRFKLSVGIIGLTQHKYQEKFYSYRYILKTVQDEHGMSTSADLGANMQIKLHEKLKLNLFALNGEGYKHSQDDFGMQRIGSSIVAKPVKGLTLNAFYTFMPGKYDVYGNDSIYADTSTVINMSFFAGYKISDKLRIGAEYNIMKNGVKYSKVAGDQDLTAISVFTTYSFTEKLEIFGRFDQVTSNKLSGTDDVWNIKKDGSLFMGGVQYSPVKGVKTSLNYRYFKYTDSDINPNSMIYVNFEYKF